MNENKIAKSRENHVFSIDSNQCKQKKNKLKTYVYKLWEQKKVNKHKL